MIPFLGENLDTILWKLMAICYAEEEWPCINVILAHQTWCYQQGHTFDKFKNMYAVCIYVFVLSHGQADVNRDFSINKNSVVVNL